MRGLKMMMHFAQDPSVEALAAAEANLHCWILRLYIDRHGFCVELFVLVSVTHWKALADQLTDSEFQDLSPSAATRLEAHRTSETPANHF